MKKIHFILVALAFLAMPVAKGQLQIQTLSSHPTWNADSLVRNIMLGEGVEIMNVQLNGSSGVIGGQTGVGIFTTGNSPTNLGLQSGICLSASAMSYINTTGGTQANNSTLSTDADLYAIVGMAVNNCMVLEFDFVPRADSVRFRYVFASEEYYGYECSQFNDVFAFFLSGVNPTGGVYNKLNIARVPNTETPITINTVNGGESHGTNTPCILTNTQYFVDNRSQAHVKHMDGFTTVLTAEARVIPCQTYHLKMAIANVSDNILPSAVFLEANSLTSNAIEFEFTNAANEQAPEDLYEGCVATVRLHRPQAKYQATTVGMEYTGTATNGVDFTMINPVIAFPAGQSEIILTLDPTMDGQVEGVETAKFRFSPSDGCLNSDSVSFNIIDTDPLVATIRHDSITSTTTNVMLRAHIEGGMPNRTVTWKNLSTDQVRTGDSTLVPTAPDTRWVLIVEDFCSNISTDTVLIGRRMDFNYILRAPYGTDRLSVLRITDTIICDQDTVRLYAHGADSCVWYTADGNIFELHDSVVAVTPHECTMYYCHSYMRWNDQWWEDLDSMVVNVVPLPEIHVTASQDRICQGTSTTLTATGAAQFSWIGDSNFAAANTYTVRPDTTTVFHVYGLTNGAECYGHDTIKIIVDTMPIIKLSEPTGVCGGEMADLFVETVAERFTWSAQPADPSLGGQELNSHIMVLPSVSTTYTLTASTGVCVTSATTSVAVEPMPKAIGEVDPVTVSLGKMEATFIDLSQNATTRVWELPYGETSTEQRVRYMVPGDVDSVTVRLWAYNPYQCFDTTTVTVYVDHTTIWAPNAFTPEESTNRTFDVKVNDIQRYHILIYDRRGQLVFESYDPEKPWNGNAQNGKKCPQGVYSFIISCHKITSPFDQIIERGTVLLIR